MDASKLSPHWWQADERSQRSDALVTLVDTLADSQKYRRTNALASVCLFEGRQIPALAPEAYEHAGDYVGDDYDKLTWNIPRSLALTVQAKIAGTQKPKVQFVVTDGDWSVKRKARKLDKFIEGQMHQRQGIYADVWQLGQQLVLDACVMDSNAGVAKITADFHARKVSCERVWPWEVFYDPHEVRAGAPRTIYHRYRYDRDALKREFADDKDKLALIELAEVVSEHDDETHFTSADRRATDQVWVYEAWRLPHGDQEGLRVLAVSSGELDAEPWDHDGFPFVLLRWTPEMLAAWGTSLVHEAESMSDEVNCTIERMREGESKLANGLLLVEEGSVDDEVVTANDIGRVVTYRNTEPKYHAPQGYSQSTVRWLELNVDKTYELPGVSQMGATARKEQGVEAAVAMRTMNDIQTERFSVFASAYEQMFVEIAKRMIWATSDLAEEHGDIVAKWPGETVMNEIRWKDVSLPEDTYRIRPYPVGQLKNTPADRLSLAQDLLGAGTLSPDAFARVTQHLDTPGELGRANKQREWVAKLIESWLDYDPANEDGFVLQAPIPFMSLEDAILQVAEAYFEALLEDVPDANQEFFLHWMEQCDRLLMEKMQKLAAAQAPPAPPPGAAPPGPPPAGAGPMPPPGPMPGAPPGPAPIPAAAALPPAA